MKPSLAIGLAIALLSGSASAQALATDSNESVHTPGRIPAMQSSTKRIGGTRIITNTTVPAEKDVAGAPAEHEGTNTTDAVKDDDLLVIPTTPDVKAPDAPVAPAVPRLRSDTTGLRSDREMFEKRKEKKEK